MSLELNRILCKDAEIVSSKKDRYVTENQFQYRLLIKSWMAMISDPTLERTLISLMNDHGLIRTIHLMASVGDNIISSISNGPDPVDGEDMTMEEKLINQLVAGVRRCSDDIRDQLQIARYPKRFQPVDADKVQASTLSKFKVGLNNAKMRNRRDLSKPGYLHDILDRARGLLEEVMGSCDLSMQEILDIGRMTPGKDPYDIKTRVDKMYRSRFTSFPLGHGMQNIVTARTPKYSDKDINGNIRYVKKTPYDVDVYQFWAFDCTTGYAKYLCWEISDELTEQALSTLEEYVISLEESLGKPEAFMLVVLQGGHCKQISEEAKRGEFVPLEEQEQADLAATFVTRVVEEDITTSEMFEPRLNWGTYVDWWGTSLDEFITIFTASVEVVPKNSKSGRVIAREECTRQWFLTAIREHTYENMRKWFLKARRKDNRVLMPVTPEDQSPNQRLAYLSSMTGEYATIDWSEASDRVSYVLAKSTLPTEHFRWRAAFRSRFLKIDGKLCTNHYWATMGAANTWSDMSFILWAIAEAVRESVERFLDLPAGSLPRCIVFGDDTVVATVVAETFVQIMESLGMKCNLEKSFISGPYRESCGVEFVNGTSVETAYWPRRALRVTRESFIPETYAALCDLQHKFFDWPQVAAIFDHAIRDIVGKRYTSCEPLTERLEPWSYAPVYDIAPNPHYAPDAPKEAGETDVVYRHLVAQNKLPSLPKDLYTNPVYSTYLEYKYWEYLRLGPSLSEDPVLRSLGISESRLRPGDFSSGKLTLEKLDFTD